MKLKQNITVLLILGLTFSCNERQDVRLIHHVDSIKYSRIEDISLIILGNVQDAGSPHIACTKDCCRDLFEHHDNNRKVVSFGIIDPKNKQTFLFEASPDMPFQMKILKKYSPFNKKETPDGIFVTHAHIGHYAGLMFLGREAMNAKEVPVYASARMKTFLEQNGPWDQLVSLKNIIIKELQNEEIFKLNSDLKVIPFQIPHRDEYSETLGFTIIGPNKKVLFIPDIDKWNKWDKDIIEEISKVDYALLDATFFDGNEIKNRDISEIPHPFVVESMELFRNLPVSEKNKIYFIHLNHSNPLLKEDSEQTKQVQSNGHNIARMHDIIKL